MAQSTPVSTFPQFPPSNDTEHYYDWSDKASLWKWVYAPLIFFGILALLVLLLCPRIYKNCLPIRPQVATPAPEQVVPAPAGLEI